MSRHRLLLPLTWLSATVAAIALAWFAVTSAIADTAERVMPADARSAPLIGSAQSVFQSTSTSTDTSSAPPQPAPNTSSASPRGGPATSRRSSGPEDSSSASESTSSPGVAPVVTGSRVFSTPGGSVTVDCNGSEISLRYSSPNDGYSQDVRHRGPEEVEVKFSAPGRPTYEVKVLCVNGQPVQPPSDG